MQNNGSGLQSAATAHWETKKDGLISVQLGGETFFCIVTIFAMGIWSGKLIKENKHMYEIEYCWIRMSLDRRYIFVY